MVGTLWILVEWMSQWFLRSHDNSTLHPNVFTREKLCLQILAQPPPTHKWISQNLKWQVRKFSVLFDPNFWYFNVTDFLSQMSASFLFSLLLSQQAYKYFQWNLTNWHILHFVNHIHTNSSLAVLPSCFRAQCFCFSGSWLLTQMPSPWALLRPDHSWI